MLYTSYFAKVKEVPNPIAISGGVPDRYKGERYKDLAPSWDLVGNYKTGKISEDRYREIYTEEVLDYLTPERVISELPEECTLLCWEVSGEFCHRHIVADWLRAGGYFIQEWRWANYS